MKRVIFCLASLVVSVIAMPGAMPVSAQDVNNFSIRNFEADYYLDKDTSGRSTLKTVEKITAIFPDYDQNHGLERAIPKEYDGHTTDPNIVSITDEKGKGLTYSDETSTGDNLIVRVGDADTYVHGEKTYVITYTQRDVTKFFADTNDDEFYWDTNGTQWAQQIDEAHIRVHVASGLEAQLNNRVACYQGGEGSSTQCELTRAPAGDTTVFSAQATRLKPGENMTVAIGFAPHTFAAYEPTMAEKILGMVLAAWGVLLVITSPLAIIGIIWLSVRYYRTMRRARGRETIIPEYLPPKNTSVLLSAQVLKNAGSDMTAQLIDLAVRHYIKIYQTKDKTMFAAAEYELELVKDVDTLLPEEKRLIEGLFGAQPKLGARFAMKRLQQQLKIRQKLQAGRKALQKKARGSYAMFERAETEARRFRSIGVATLILGILLLSPLVIVLAIVAFSLAHGLWPLTEKGAELRDYLKGLKEYITVAEEDRIKMLQSPEGAEKVGIKVTGDEKQLVKLYERVLPYAVLFGVEKEWTKQLGVHYESTGAQPDWYSGNGAFNAVVFSSAVSGFSSQSSAYSGSASAASGGSGGGGFSGGGGGGGGGGGW